MILNHVVANSMVNVQLNVFRYIDTILPKGSLSWYERFVKVCCKGYSITLQQFKRNEGRVQGT